MIFGDLHIKTKPLRTDGKTKAQKGVWALFHKSATELELRVAPGLSLL